MEFPGSFSLCDPVEVVGQTASLLDGHLCDLRMTVRVARLNLQAEVAYGKDILAAHQAVVRIHQNTPATACFFFRDPFEMDGCNTAHPDERLG